MPRPNRRTIIASAAALWAPSALAGVDGANDKVHDACLRYLAMEDRVMELLDEWPSLESRLAKAHPNFLGRPLEEQARYPGGHRFLEIQTELESLDVERDRLMPLLVRSGCRTVGAALAKLMVVERVILPDDYPHAHRLVSDTVRDLRRLLAA